MTARRVVVDYTTARLHSKSDRGRKIERCPECGRKSERTRYTDGTELYVHDLVVGMWAATVGDHCTIAADRLT